jgi:hypothetical protein
MNQFAYLSIGSVRVRAPPSGRFVGLRRDSVSPLWTARGCSIEQGSKQATALGEQPSDAADHFFPVCIADTQIGERTAGFGCLGATGKTIVDESAESAPKRGSMSWIGQHAPQPAPMRTSG